MDFPHLKDTNFPLIDNVNVYKYKNNFDYARWNGKVSYKLMNVKWNSSYADVPYFTTDVLRDEWFDAQDGIVGTLESIFNNTPKDTVKIPIPYNDMYHCNYLIVDMPIQTSAEKPINYGNENLRVKRWFFFINDMEQFAPSTTELKIEVDYWTTFINTVSIPYLMLERGHAPMMQISVETYLANPILNNEYLLAPDFNYGDDTIIKTSVYKPIGNGVKYVLFCAPFDVTSFTGFNSAAWGGNSTPPSYADESTRWGYQLDVNDYAWKYGNADYSDADMHVENMIQTGILNGCQCYAIEATQAKVFFNECAEQCVQLIHGIKAMFILDESLFTKTSNFTFMNKTIYVVGRKINTENVSFTKAAFGFDSKYADIAKLYTSPYSILEITDDNGNVFSAKVENTGNIQMHEEVSLVYPFLNYNVFFSGINGDGTMNYVWKTVDDSVNGTSKTMWASDFSKFMMNWNIPTYEIYVSAENEFAVNNAANVATKRAGAIKDYQNAVRYANTTYENMAASLQTNTDNVGRTGDTNWENTKRATQADVDNVSDSMDTLEDNTNDINDCNKKNAFDDVEIHRINTTCGTQTATKITTEIHNPYMAKINDANCNKIDSDKNVANATALQITQYNNEYASVTNGISVGASIGSAVVGGIGGITSISNNDGASVVGSLVGIVKAEIGAIASSSITTQCISTDLNIVNAQMGSNSAYANNSIILNDYLNGSDGNGPSNLPAIGILQMENAQTTNAQNYSAVRQADNNKVKIEGGYAYDCDVQNPVKNCYGTANRTQETLDTNVGRTKTTNNGNASRTKLATDENAKDLKDTNNTNASATQTTETDNAMYNRDATVEAEKANLVQKQLEAENAYKNSRLHVPYQQGFYTGDFAPDVYQRRGVRFNIRTQSKSAIAQAGDAMLRFGYALHRVWDMSEGFHYCNKFTFWKAEDIWINDGTGVANVATNAIAQILLSGVTVWRNPSEIGTVGIYDNIGGAVL